MNLRIGELHITLLRYIKLPLPRIIWRYLFGGLLCLVVVTVIYRMTERAHFKTNLQRTLWELGQSSGSPKQLQAEERLKLLRQLRSPTAEKRWEAAKILASWKDRDAVPDLIVAMQDDKGTRRTCEIAHALGQIGDATCVPALSKAISHSRNVDLRVCATQALTEIGGEEALAPLLKKVTRPNLSKADYMGTIFALGELGLPGALPVLRAIAKRNTDARIRELAESAVAQIELLDGEDVVPKLLAALDNDSDWIHDRWIFDELDKRWDDRGASALNDYLARGKNIRTDNLIQAAALLIHHQGLMPSTTEALARSSQRHKRWLARLVQPSPILLHSGRI